MCLPAFVSGRSPSESCGAMRWQLSIFFNLTACDIFSLLLRCKLNMDLQQLSHDGPTVTVAVLEPSPHLPSLLAGASDAHGGHLCAHLHRFCFAFCVPRRLESGESAWLFSWKSVLMSKQAAVVSSEVDNETFLFVSFLFSLLLSYLMTLPDWGLGMREAMNTDYLVQKCIFRLCYILHIPLVCFPYRMLKVCW